MSFLSFFPLLDGIVHKKGSQPSTNFVYTATKLIKIQFVRCVSAVHSVCRMKQAGHNNFVF